MEAGLVQILEGALLAAGEPLSVQRMALLFEESERPSNEDIRAAIKSVEERCEDRGYELVQVASGYRFQVRSHVERLRKFVVSPSVPILSRHCWRGSGFA
jgi:segregation and condensation protein B